MHGPLSCGEGDGLGAGEADGDGAGDGTFAVGVGCAASVATDCGLPAGAAAVALAPRVGWTPGDLRGWAAGWLGTGDGLAAGAAGRAALTGPCPCGTAARYTAAEPTATTADAVPQATQ